MLLAEAGTDLGTVAVFIWLGCGLVFVALAAMFWNKLWDSEL